MPEYRRKLPHFHPDQAYLFLTWRLGRISKGCSRNRPEILPGDGPLFLVGQAVSPAVFRHG
jgi:hypothetical protein